VSLSWHIFQTTYCFSFNAQDFLYAIGGGIDNSSVVRFGAESQEWSKIEGMSMLPPREAHGVAKIRDSVYIIGGVTDETGGVYIFDFSNSFDHILYFKL
jgi:hypothetical protein